MRSLRAVGLAALLLVALVPVAAAQAQDDCGSGRDAPDTSGGEHPPVALVSPADCAGAIGAGDEFDFYAFELPHGMNVTVRVEAQDEGQEAVACVYPPARILPTPCASNVTEQGFDPRTWRVRVHLCEPPGCALSEGAYRLTLVTWGNESLRQHETGSIALGHPLGSTMNRALGPSDLDGLDGRWHDLRESSEMRDFVRVSWSGCDDCLHLSWQFDTGSVFRASCQRTDAGTLDCPMPQRAVRVLVGASAGRDVGYALDVWYAQGA